MQKFITEPNHISFENFKHGDELSRKIKIINQDDAIRQININFVEKPEINVKIFGDQRIAPGLSVMLTVNFFPTLAIVNAKKDLQYDITLKSAQANYHQVIPITG
jgi:hypothetical protein